MLELVFPIVTALATVGAIDSSKDDVRAGAGFGQYRFASACASPAWASAMMNEEPGATLGDDALRTLLSNVSVTDIRTGQLDDGPEEVFRVNGIYQRIAGRGSALGVPFEIRDGAVCVPNGGAPPRCRRVRPNRDGTYTFIDTADGTSAVMTVTASIGRHGRGSQNPVTSTPTHTAVTGTSPAVSTAADVPSGQVGAITTALDGLQAISYERTG